MENIDKRPTQGRGQNFVPNPLETIPPLTARDAFEDALRFAVYERQVEDVRTEALSADSSAVVGFVNGSLRINRELTQIEDVFAQTLQYCLRRGLISTPAQAIGTMAGIQFDLQHKSVLGIPKEGNQ